MSTFHPFNKLPVELRLQIWNAACLPSTSRDRGIQYIDVHKDQVLPLSCNWSLTLDPELGRSSQQLNTSAYLIDGGLWRACEESREVVRKSSHFQDWLRMRQRFNACRRNWEYSADWPGGEDAVRPAIVTIREDDERWHMMVYPTRDIFSIRTGNWLSIYGDPYAPRSYIPTNVFGTDVQLFIKNIAIEYDPTWSLDFPMSLDRLSAENSSRGYLAKLLIDRASNRHRDGPENIWLIDKEARWTRYHSKWIPDVEELQEVPTPRQDITTGYRDCHADYIEISWNHSTGRRADDYPSSKAFITKLGMQFDSQLLYICWHVMHPNSIGPGYQFNARETYKRFTFEHAIRFLVRADNEVKPNTTSCKTKCHDIGWCICSED